ncbi:MAG: YkvA family protein [Elainellaceae cyanobacterium]
MKRLFVTPLVNWFRSLLRNPKYRWVIILGSLFYLVSPLDISPDVFPVLGWIDDGLLATLVVTELTQMAIDSRRDRINKSTQKADITDDDNIIDVESIRVS